MLNEQAYRILFANLLPLELNEHFDLVNVIEEHSLCVVHLQRLNLTFSLMKRRFHRSLLPD